jgi:hypothetical protein
MGRYGVSLYLAFAMLAGCGHEQGQAAPLAPLAQSYARQTSTSGGNLLYASDWNKGEIFIFTYPAGTLVGTIADNQYPLGLCSDLKGNVWVTNFGGGINQLVEYAHGGTTPIATLDDPGEEPRSCSVDPITGNLAVANGGRGNVAIYAKASGTPQSYDPGLVYPFACAYDGNGNLFVDGYHLHGQANFALSELPVGGAAFERIRFKDKIAGLPGNVQWDGTEHDGTDLAVGDYQSPNTIYTITVAKRRPIGVLAATIVLQGPVVQPPDGVEFWIQGDRLVMPFGLHSKINQIGFWTYPAGGSHTKELYDFNAAELFGVTISR